MNENSLSNLYEDIKYATKLQEYPQIIENVKVKDDDSSIVFFFNNFTNKFILKKKSFYEKLLENQYIKDELKNLLNENGVRDE